MSALGQKRTLPTSLDDVVGAGDQRRRHSKAERLGSFEVDDQLVLCWQLNWKIARLLALENAGDINASTAIGIGLTCSITDQTLGIDKSTVKNSLSGLRLKRQTQSLDYADC